MLYVADWVAMASLEMDSKSGTDWEAVSRGFDPTITDQRETNFLDLVMSGEEQIGKVNFFDHSSALETIQLTVYVADLFTNGRRLCTRILRSSKDYLPS